jgi:polyisoprenyl-phosphate glycosyltransferase
MIISVVIPVYPGADHLVALTEALAREHQRWETEGTPFKLGEAIFVDDASIDSSSEVLRDIDAKNDWIRVVTLARNFGQHPATIAGILHTPGDWVVL